MLSPLSIRRTAAFDARDDLRWGTKAYDLFAAIPLVSWYGLVALGQLHVIAGQVGQLDLSTPDLVLIIAILAKVSTLLFAVMVIGLLFARQPARAGAQGVVPRVMAIAGTYLGIAIVLMPGRHLPSWALVLSTLMIMGGMGFAVYSMTWLGRSISMLPEARNLVTGGPYRIVRHPLYLGEQIAIAGAAIQFLSPATMLIVLLQFLCQLYRMLCEERVLEQTFPEYGSYKQRTSRLIPGVY